MLITSITPSKKKRMYDLYIDGELFAAIPEQTLVDYRVIAKGNEVDMSTLQEILVDSMRASAYADAMNYIASSMRTIREVQDKLYRIGYAPDAVSEAISRMQGYGYIDDRDYAERYVDKYRYTKGVVRIRHELCTKGVAEDLIDEALSEFEEYEPAKAEAERYAPRVKGDRSKLYRHLLSRGYTSSVVGEVVSQVIGEYDD